MNKFLTFYSNQDNKEHDIDEMKKSSFAEEHKDHLFCPNCKKAKLVYYHKTSTKQAYFATNPTSKHDNTCIYNYSQISQKAMTEYIHNLECDPQKLNDKLDAFERVLFNKTVLNKSNNTTPHNTNPLIIPKTNNNGTISKKTVRYKSLRNLEDADDGSYLYYINDVSVRVKETKSKFGEYSIYSLNIFKNNRYICTINRGQIKDSINENCKYNILFFGEKNKDTSVNVHKDTFRIKVV